MPDGGVAQPLQHLAAGRNLPEGGAGRLQDDRGDISVRRESGIDVSVCKDTGNDSWRATFGKADVIVPAVKKAGEADDFVPAGEGPGHAERQVRALGTRVKEAYPFGRRNQFVDKFHPLKFQFV